MTSSEEPVYHGSGRDGVRSGMVPLQATHGEYWRRMCLAMDFIQDHLDEDISLDDISEAAFFSKYYFHRLFHTFVGETVAAHVSRLRLERSASLLRYQPRLSIVAMACELGFSSSQNFAKRFRQWSGLSPTRYRRKALGEAGRLAGRRPEASESGRPALERCWQAAPPEMLPEVTLVTRPERHVAYIREVGPYRRQRQGRALKRLQAWAWARGLSPDGELLGVFLDNPAITSPQRCRYDACLVVPPGCGGDGEVGVRLIPGGTYAVWSRRRKTDRYAGDWEDLLSAWLPWSGHQLDYRPNCELVRAPLSRFPHDRLLVDICLPVKPR